VQRVDTVGQDEVEYLAAMKSQGELADFDRYVNWAGLVGILSTDATIPSDVSATFIDLLQLVRSRPELHDKFWRYMELFRDVVNNSDTIVAPG